MTNTIRALTVALLCFVLVAAAQTPSPSRGASARPAPELEEATIADLQQRMQSGQETARSLVEKYTARIEAIDRGGPALHSVIELNPEALAIADSLDAERKSRGPRGPLHGIPVLLKDNIATADRMMTTAGSMALAGVAPPKDAFIVQRLRQAGAVILGKTNLSEWANYRSTHSTSGWSGRGGQTHESLFTRSQNPVRFELRFRRRDRSQPGGDRRWNRDRRLRGLTLEQQRAGRHQADAWTSEPHRYRADLAQPGHSGADGPDRDRRRTAARRHERHGCR